MKSFPLQKLYVERKTGRKDFNVTCLRSVSVKLLPTYQARDICSQIYIIIAFDQKLSFSDGNLILPTDEDKRGWVVDGQHRLAGIQQAKWKHKLAVVILSDLTIEDMASLFRTINSTQKGVPTSLLYDLLGLTKDGEFEEIRGHELAVKLNDEPESPLHSGIDMLGSGPNRISQARIVNSLKTVNNRNRTSQRIPYRRSIWHSQELFFSD